MTPGEFKEIAKAMHEYGIERVKMGDCEFIRRAETNLKMAYESIQKGLNESLPEGVSLDPADPIKHKVDQMASLMKLSDTELVDQLFPDKSEESA